MKSLFYPILSLLMLAAASSAQAQLDKTQAEWDEHCGKPVELTDHVSVSGVKKAVYKAEGYEITVMFVKGRAGSMDMHKLNNASFADSEIDSILKSNEEGAQWKPIADNKGLPTDGKPEKGWSRPDGWFAAYLYDEDNKYRYLIIETKWYSDYYKAHKNK